MFIVSSYTLAVGLCFITMLCWGSWANTQKIAAKSLRFELFYWDYVLGILLFSLLFGFTFGSLGTKGMGFVESIGQASTASIINPIIGGIIFNLSNILLVAAIALAGMAGGAVNALAGGGTGRLDGHAVHLEAPGPLAAAVRDLLAEPARPDAPSPAPAPPSLGTPSP